MAMPLLVQLHLRPGPQLDLAIVRQELLQGAFHALHHLCMQHGATSAVPRGTKTASQSITWPPETLCLNDTVVTCSAGAESRGSSGVCLRSAILGRSPDTSAAALEPTCFYHGF